MLSVADLAGAATSGSLSLLLAELAAVPRAALVIEGRWRDLAKLDVPVRPGWLFNLVAALQVEHPQVCWMFAETRSLAEDFAYRRLAAVRQCWQREHVGRSRDPDNDRPAAPHELDTPIDPGARTAKGASRAAERSATWTVHQYLTPSPRDREERIEEFKLLLTEWPEWTTAEYAEHFGVSTQTAGIDLKQLVEDGILLAEGKTRARRYVGRRD